MKLLPQPIGLAQEKSCSHCETIFTCGPKNGRSDCWCAELPHIPPPAGVDQDCLCPTCLREAISNLSSPPLNEARSNLDKQFSESNPPSLLEGDDYYFESGLMVFTKSFHLRRGSCCQSGCRHCPYGFR